MGFFRRQTQLVVDVMNSTLNPAAKAEAVEEILVQANICGSLEQIENPELTDFELHEMLQESRDRLEALINPMGLGSERQVVQGVRAEEAAEASRG
jgi:hypothetical protein